MKIGKQSLKNLISFLVFMLLILEVYVHCTYLFRNTNRSGRLNVLGLYYEKEDSIDVICIGGSNVFMYWDCMYAWNKYGFTSYNYSVSHMASESTISAIEDIKRNQDPAVIVLDVRKLLPDYADNKIGIAVRSVVDSWDLNFDRLKTIKYFCDLHDIPLEDAITAYIDLIQYHDNHEALADNMNWQLIDNRINEPIDTDDFYKGFYIEKKHTFYTEPEIVPEDTEDLNEEQEKIYRDILEYCSEKEINLFLTASPYVMDKKEAMILNKMDEIAKEYGFPFFDGHKYVDEMGLDYKLDFHDENHVNVIGADKYTDYLAGLLSDNYNLPDHRNDPSYSSWDEVYDIYIDAVEAAQIQIKEYIEAENQAIE
ncbi:MAG: hypothetical protein J1E98_08225 [Lachnospiraceae bacterium]|nr:hypothetical protein [Lachnospiraceae bacterium]